MAKLFISRSITFLLILYSVSLLAQTPNERARLGRKNRSMPVSVPVHPDFSTDDTLRFATSYEPVVMKKPDSTSTVREAIISVQLPGKLPVYQENSQDNERVFLPKMIVRPALNLKRSRLLPPVNDTETSDLERILNRKKQSN